LNRENALLVHPPKLSISIMYLQCGRGVTYMSKLSFQ
jgi:hypothetical protein